MDCRVTLFIAMKSKEWTGTRPALSLGQNAFHNVAVDVGETEAAALVAVGQFGVVDSAEV